jgi:hypothetical protein
MRAKTHEQAGPRPRTPASPTAQESYARLFSRVGLSDGQVHTAAGSSAAGATGASTGAGRGGGYSGWSRAITSALHAVQTGAAAAPAPHAANNGPLTVR